MLLRAPMNSRHYLIHERALDAAKTQQRIVRDDDFSGAVLNRVYDAFPQRL